MNSDFLRVYIFQKVLDHFVAIILILVLTIMALSSYSNLIEITDVAARVTSVTDLRVDMQYNHALHGEWPGNLDKIERTRPESIQYVSFHNEDTLEVEDGAIHIFTKGKRLDGEIVSLRPATPLNNTTGPVIWVVGDKLRNAGFIAHGQNRTTIASQFIPYEMK